MWITNFIGIVLFAGSLLSVFFPPRFPSSIDSTRYVRGKLATNDKPMTFNQPWTVEEQVGFHFKSLNNLNASYWAFKITRRPPELRRVARGLPPVTLFST
jgi:hypothetical protein